MPSDKELAAHMLKIYYLGLYQSMPAIPSDAVYIILRDYTEYMGRALSVMRIQNLLTDDATATSTMCLKYVTTSLRSKQDTNLKRELTGLVKLEYLDNLL